MLVVSALVVSGGGVDTLRFRLLFAEVFVEEEEVELEEYPPFKPYALSVYLELWSHPSNAPASRRANCRTMTLLLLLLGVVLFV